MINWEENGTLANAVSAMAKTGCSETHKLFSIQGYSHIVMVFKSLFPHWIDQQHLHTYKGTNSQCNCKILIVVPCM